MQHPPPITSQRSRTAQALLILLVAVLGMVAATTAAASATTLSKQAPPSGPALAPAAETRVGVAATSSPLFVARQPSVSAAQVGQKCPKYLTIVVASCVATESGGGALEPSPWPPNNGAIPGTERATYLEPGTRIDRYGRPDAGGFVSPEGVPYENRALRPGTEGYTVYEVYKPLPVTESRAAPWFNQPGGGPQYELPVDIRVLLKRNLISIVKD